MIPFYEDASPYWYAKLMLFWASWLIWPVLLALLVWGARGWRRWRWPRRAALVAMLLPVLLFVDARFIEPQLIVQRTTRLQLGFKARLVLVADYHIGLYKGPEFLARVVDRINAIGPDAVLIAGDHTYEPARPLKELLAPLRGLHGPTYSVPGNHDEGMPGPPLQQDLRAALKAHGVVPVEYGSAQLKNFTIVGLGDRWAGKDSMVPLITAPKGKPIVVLMHNPDSVMQLPPASAALALAGHTHGGQVRIPWLYRRVIPTRYPFDRGLHTFAPVPTFVTSGLGEVGLPLRFLNPPVIDILDIE